MAIFCIRENRCAENNGGHKEEDTEIIWVDRAVERSFFVLKELIHNSKNHFLVADTEAVHSRFILRDFHIFKNTRRFWIQLKGEMASKREILSQAC